MKTDVENLALRDVIARVRERRKARPAPLPKSGWLKVAGTVKDDELFREAARRGEEWRKVANERP